MNTLSDASKYRERFFMLAAGAIALFFVVGCAQSYGKFSSDDNLDQSFKNGEILKELKYYYSGRENRPEAMIGVDSTYTLSADIWIAFDPGSKEAKENKAYGYRGQSYMLAPDSTVVGVWFFGPTQRSIKVDQENRIVEVMYRVPPRH